MTIRRTHSRRTIPSLLDDLLDDEPNHHVEAVSSQHALIRQTQEAIRRDIQDLLNTRLPFLLPSPAYTELTYSLATYGLPKPSIDDVRQVRSFAAMCLVISEAIREFEPRLGEPRAYPDLPAGSPMPLDGVMRFTIEGQLTRPDGVVEIAFQAAYDTFDGKYTLELGA